MKNNGKVHKAVSEERIYYHTLARTCLYLHYYNLYPRQGSKLRVHPAPGVHILSARCTDFSNTIIPL